MAFSETVQVNAWTGQLGNNSSDIGLAGLGWGLARESRVELMLGAEDPPDPKDWQNPRVGWGLVLPENTSIHPSERARADDAPEPIRRLWIDRGEGPVFRYDNALEPGKLRRYGADGRVREPKVEGSEQGVADHQIPLYLLICGSPEVIPWSVQYNLNQSAHVGRLDLPEEGLKNYVDALIAGWPDSRASANRPVVWAVDLEGGDITNLMRRGIAEPLALKLRGDKQIGGELRTAYGAAATNTRLIELLAERKPAFIVTTSHGATIPLDDADAMRAQLGAPVDQDGNLLAWRDVLGAWSPDGAIWYAHACCAAGADAPSLYRGLFGLQSNVGGILKAVAEVGAVTSPLPRALLSAEKPLRAFVGHVEPTFDWTLRDPWTGQSLTTSLQESLYTYQHLTSGPQPIGLALMSFYREVGALLFQSSDARLRLLNSGDEQFERVAVQRKVAAFDRQSLVILGDPTVALPPLD